eukprot:TRINITY_DN4919_c0_g1::TRINITY_DN4919_c0_g1_i1::g.16719::m.16719 TRINITY_DN4919_c0_g1::TRINITY_DN4919_c0_g1_i1::g.16719  ORF type:complete len:102 (+),score=5.60 TRINITY_DN4919_c0_g1_i1:301-606(+)
MTLVLSRIHYIRRYTHHIIMSITIIIINQNVSLPLRRYPNLVINERFSITITINPITLVLCDDEAVSIISDFQQHHLRSSSLHHRCHYCPIIHITLASLPP